MEYKKRQTAYKIRIVEINNGKFMKDENSVNLVKTAVGAVSRVNLSAIVVAKETSDYFSGIVIDDGTGSIPIRAFENKGGLEGFDVGDIINIIGRVRIYREQKYVGVEIIKKIDKVWLEHRNKELEILEKIYKSKIDSSDGKVSGKVVEESVVDSDAETICGLIRKSDGGEGADTEYLIKNSKIDNCEQILKELLRKGDVFEIRPGKLKVLE